MNACVLSLQTDEAENLVEEAADKPAGKNWIPLVPDYRDSYSLELNSERHIDTPSSWSEYAIYDITL